MARSVPIKIGQASIPRIIHPVLGDIEGAIDGIRTIHHTPSSQAWRQLASHTLIALTILSSASVMLSRPVGRSGEPSEWPRRKTATAVVKSSVADQDATNKENNIMSAERPKSAIGEQNPPVNNSSSIVGLPDALPRALTPVQSVIDSLLP